MKLDKIKNRHKNGGFNIKYSFNSYFAAWIANFGVVPLFLLAAFLLAPAFFFFLSLLLLVTHVLETIRQLLFRYKSNQSRFLNFKPSFLPIKDLCVKGLFISFATLFCLEVAMANTLTRNIVLSKGQSTEIALSGLSKFNIGNREVLTYQFNEKTKSLLLRGQKLGHSEIIVWNQDKSVDKYEVFVISKIQEEKLLALTKEANALNLNVQILIPTLRISGVIKSLNDYLHYKKLLKKNKDIILDEVSLDNRLSAEIYGKIFSAFFNDYKENIKCEDYYSEILCFYPENEAPSETLKKFLSEKYQVHFIQNSAQQFKKNYLLKLKLIQLEQLDGEDLRLGLEQISGNLGEFLSKPIDTIIQKNQILLNQKNIRMSTLAEPQTILRSLTPAEIQIGADIPFKSSNSQNVQSTDWKFAGLKVHVLLENYGDKLKINYDTELTQPNSDSNGIQSIGGNKEKSSAILKLNSATKVFQLTLKTEGKSTDQMPYLHAIPILGELFKSKSNQSNVKTITGIIEVSENE